MIDCCGLVKYAYTTLFPPQKEISIEEARKSIENEVIKWRKVKEKKEELSQTIFLTGGLVTTKDHSILMALRFLDFTSSKNTKEFWNFYSQKPGRLPKFFTEAFKKFEEEKVEEGHAIELCCGQSQASIELLKKGWTVTALDTSQEALNRLEELANKTNKQWLESKQLILVCKDMETFQFPKNVTFIFCIDGLSYCNPKKFEKVWNRACQSLQEGGRIAGNFFFKSKSLNKEEETYYRASMEGWYTDKPVVKALLENNKIESEVCRYDRYWFPSYSANIEFIGKKTN